LTFAADVLGNTDRVAHNLSISAFRSTTAEDVNRVPNVVVGGDLGTARSPLGNVHIDTDGFVIFENDLQSATPGPQHVRSRGDIVLGDARGGSLSYDSFFSAHYTDPADGVVGEYQTMSNILVKNTGATEFWAGGAFVMHENDRMNVFGDLKITSPRVIVGDLTVAGNVEIVADHVQLQQRAPLPAIADYDQQSVVPDPNVDIVSGKSVGVRSPRLNALPGTAPSLKAPVIGANNLQSFGILAAPSAGVDAGKFRIALGAEAILDRLQKPPDTLVSGGGHVFFVSDPITGIFALQVPRANDVAITSEGAATLTAGEGFVRVPSGAIAGAIPRIKSPVIQEINPSLAQQKDLQDLGVFARDSHDDRFPASLQGPSIYLDLPRKSDPRSEDFQVSPNRLSGELVSQLLADYNDLFRGDDRTPDGKVRRRDSRNDVANTIAVAYAAFEADGAGSHATVPEDPMGFRAFLESHPDGAVALKDVNRLRGLIARIENLGLSPVEAQVSETHLLRGLNPPGTTPAEFKAAVLGASWEKKK